LGSAVEEGARGLGPQVLDNPAIPDHGCGAGQRDPRLAARVGRIDLGVRLDVPHDCAVVAHQEEDVGVLPGDPARPGPAQETSRRTARAGRARRGAAPPTAATSVGRGRLTRRPADEVASIVVTIAMSVSLRSSCTVRTWSGSVLMSAAEAWGFMSSPRDRGSW